MIKLKVIQFLFFCLVLLAMLNISLVISGFSPAAILGIFLQFFLLYLLLIVVRS